MLFPDDKNDGVVPGAAAVAVPNKDGLASSFGGPKSDGLAPTAAVLDRAPKTLPPDPNTDAAPITPPPLAEAVDPNKLTPPGTLAVAVLLPL